MVRSGGVASEPNAIGKRCVRGELKIASSLPVAANVFRLRQPADRDEHVISNFILIIKIGIAIIR